MLLRARLTENDIQADIKKREREPVKQTGTQVNSKANRERNTDTLTERQPAKYTDTQINRDREPVFLTCFISM